MKITELQIRNFTVFEQVDLRFAAGINVLIGENGTGKSHVLKAIYTLLRGVPRQPVDEEASAVHQAGEMVRVFMPEEENAARLVRTGFESNGATLWLRADQGQTRCLVDESGALTIAEQTWRSVPEALFLPSRDVLAMYEGFVALYEERKLSFDQTYRDLCLALQRSELRGEAEREAYELARPLFDLLGGKVLLRGTRFYINFGNGLREAHLVAEGLRKIATLARLVGHGVLKEGSILLWDEPEAGLNPRFVRQMADTLHRLAAHGVQIFVATHDFLLSQELSLIAEYHKEPAIAMKFFALHHTSQVDPVEVEDAESLAEMQHNAILEEYAAHYDREQTLFGRKARGDKAGER